MKKLSFSLLVCIIVSLFLTGLISSIEVSNWLSAGKEAQRGVVLVGGLGCRFQKQCKSTRLLCLSGCPDGGLEGWDEIHGESYDHGHSWCWAASSSMVASYYLRKLGRSSEHLSPDVIALHAEGGLDADCAAEHFEEKHGRPLPIDYWTGHFRRGTARVYWALGYPDDSVFPCFVSERKATFSEIKVKINEGHPIICSYPGHWMVIDGYQENVTGNYAHMLDPGSNGPKWIDWATQYNGLNNFYECPLDAPDVRSDWDWDWNHNSIPDVVEDYDGDGVVDMDEIYVFKTGKADVDSDDDGIDDKMDIYSYVFDEFGHFSLRLSPDGDDYNSKWPIDYTYVNSSEEWCVDFDVIGAVERRADFDGDGLRAELDPDNDNDGILDGDEDTNGNGEYEPWLGETSVFQVDPVEGLHRLTFQENIQKHQQIAISGPYVHVVWTDGRIGGGNWEIYYKRSADYGKTWERCQRLTDSAGVSRYPSIAASSSAVHVVWEDTRSGDYQIWYRRSLDNGTVWLEEQQLSPEGGSSQNVAIAIREEHVYVVYQRLLPSQWQIFFTESTHNGAIDTWATPRRVGPLPGETSWGDNHQYPSIATSHTWHILPNMTVITLKHIHIVWETEGYNILYVHSGDDGATWGAWLRLDPDEGWSRSPKIAAANRYVHVVWQDWSIGRPELFYTNSSDSGETWHNSLRLTSASGYTGTPAIDLKGDHLVVVWEDDAYAFQNETWWKESLDNGLTWESSLRVTIDDKWTSRSPDVALDTTAIQIVWEDSKDGNLEIYHQTLFNDPLEILTVDWTPMSPPPYTPTGTPRINEPVQVTADIDDANIDQVELCFRRVGEPWYAVSMVFNSTLGLWIQTIPGQPDPCVIEFRVDVTDHYGRTASSLTYQYTLHLVLTGDIDGDSDVDIFDVVRVASNYGQSYP